MLIELLNPKIFSLIVGALSSLIAALGYQAKVKNEIKRTTKSILFLLLEMRNSAYKFHDVCKNMPEEYLAKIKPLLNKEGLVVSDAEYMDGMKIIKKYSRELAHKQFNLDMTELAPLYIQTLSELAKEDPLLAYRLKGKEAITATIKMLKEHMDSASKLDGTQMSLVLKDEIQTDFEDAFASRSVHDLTSAIKMVALRCGIFTYFKCYLLLKGKTSNQTTAEPPTIDIILQEFARKIATHQKIKNSTT